MKINIYNNKTGSTKASKPKKAKRGKYSEAEKRAWDAGRAWEVGKNGGKVELKSEKEKESFRNGVKSVRAKREKGGK